MKLYYFHSFNKGVLLVYSDMSEERTDYFASGNGILWPNVVVRCVTPEGEERWIKKEKLEPVDPAKIRNGYFHVSRRLKIPCPSNQ
jgi:hypothetical protein